jgi:hypothetical protein
MPMYCNIYIYIYIYIYKRNIKIVEIIVKGFIGTTSRCMYQIKR